MEFFGFILYNYITKRVQVTPKKQGSTCETDAPILRDLNFYPPQPLNPKPLNLNPKPLSLYPKSPEAGELILRFFLLGRGGMVSVIIRSVGENCGSFWVSIPNTRGRTIMTAQNRTRSATT